MLDTIEAGIVLSGSEVKSVKEGKIQLKGSYVSIQDNEAWLVNAHISPYKPGVSFDPEQPRKLLLKKKEINYLIGKSKEKGLTLIPTEVYLKKNLVKVSVTVARGKKEFDKREIKKKRELERSLRRKYKNVKM
jgi:SsrA-binding protein